MWASQKWLMGLKLTELRHVVIVFAVPNDFEDEVVVTCWQHL